MEKIYHGGFKKGDGVNVAMYQTGTLYTIEVERVGCANYVAASSYSYDLAVELLSRVCK